MIRTLIDGGINWDWYLCADFNEEDKTAHIFYHDRWHRYENRGSNHPVHENVNFRLLEDKDRIVHTVVVGRKDEYRVINPMYTFDYRDMTHYKPE